MVTRQQPNTILIRIHSRDVALLGAPFAILRAMKDLRRELSSLYHESSKDPTERGLRPMPPREHWPKEWTTLYFKTYPRLPRIVLPEAPAHGGIDVLAAIGKRASGRLAATGPVSIEKLSTILTYSCGIFKSENGHVHRAQPSGGGRYPLETYALVMRGSAELPSGVYHYDPRGHALDVLEERPFKREDIAELFTYEWVRDMSLAIIVTAVFARSYMKYGERGYRHIHHEAGHIGQNLYLASGAVGMHCCTMSGTIDEAIEKLLDIDGVEESLVYGAVLS